MDVGRLALLSAGGFASTALAGAGLLVAEAVLTARRGFLSADTAPAQDGTFGDAGARPLRLAVLGDSLAAGVGVVRGADTLGRQVADRLVRLGHRVSLTTPAVAGSRSADLGPQVSRALLAAPDIALVLIGSGDALHAVRPAVVARHLDDALTRLRRAGVGVAVGSCPDLGVAPAFPQPLRGLLGVQARRIAAAQCAVARAGGSAAVDLGAATSGIFRADRGTFSEDGLHPSADGYRLWAEALLPAVRGAGRTAATL